MSLLKKLSDWFLNLMMLKDDEPDAVIEATFRHTTLGKYAENLLTLSVQTDLSLYDKSERQNYCLQLHPNDEHTNYDNYLLRCVVGSTTDELEKLRDYLTSETPSLGLIGVNVNYDRTILKFASIDKPTAECLYYYLENCHGFSIAIDKPPENNNLYDPRFGEYDQLQIVTFCHPTSSGSALDMISLQRMLDTRMVFQELAHSNDADPQSGTDAKSTIKHDDIGPRHFLIDNIYYERTF